MATTAGVLGLDALPYWYVEKLREWGQTPNLLSILESAASLECIPPITEASWPSIMSGVNPGKHGIFSFFHVDRASRERRLALAWDLEHPRVHEMLSFNKRKSIMINPIPDYPILPVKYSIIVSNLFFNPSPSSHPLRIYEKYFSGINADRDQDYPAYILEYLEAVRGLLEEEGEVDLAWVTLNFPDHLFHKKPELLKSPSHASRIWKKIDKLAGQMLASYDDVYIVSDHGFRMYDYRVNVNDILYRHGYVVASQEDEEKPLVDMLARQKGARTKKVKVPKSLYMIIARLGLEPLARKAFPAVARIYERITGVKPVVRSGYSIDYKRSKAYMPEGGTYGVYIFDGTVSKQEIIEVLRKYRGIKVWDSLEVYKGPYTIRGPDVVVLGEHEKGYVLGPARIMGTIYLKTKYHSHDLWGVFAAKTGDGTIEDAIRGRTFKNTIVAPLIMCRLNVPVPKHSDDLSTLSSICGRRPEVADYTGKFRILKRLHRRNWVRERGGN